MPIEHLDFDYVRNCVNAKEIERILEILKSGEEGHYPQLTEFTEKRLRDLDPANKMLRVEHKMMRNSHPECRSVQADVEVSSSYLSYFDVSKNIYFVFTECLQAFVSEVKQQRNSGMVHLDHFLPPIRKLNEGSAARETSESKKSDRIKSCDYDQWNKYDPGILLYRNRGAIRFTFHVRMRK